jgi:hypothetical protein
VVGLKQLISTDDVVPLIRFSALEDQTAKMIGVS